MWTEIIQTVTLVCTKQFVNTILILSLNNIFLVCHKTIDLSPVLSKYEYKYKKLENNI